MSSQFSLDFSNASRGLGRDGLPLNRNVALAWIRELTSPNAGAIGHNYTLIHNHVRGIKTDVNADNDDDLAACAQAMADHAALLTLLAVWLKAHPQ